MSSKIDIVRCVQCKGSGFVKTTPIKCDKCNGKHCIICNGGYKRGIYDTCEKCGGCGSLIS